MSYQDGLTLMHEHMTIDLTPGDLGTDSFDELASDLRLIYDHGVRNSRIVNGGDKVVNKTFVSMMEALGYDVRLVYEEREASK